MNVLGMYGKQPLSLPSSSIVPTNSGSRPLGALSGMRGCYDGCTQRSIAVDTELFSGIVRRNVRIESGIGQGRPGPGWMPTARTLPMISTTLPAPPFPVPRGRMSWGIKGKSPEEGGTSCILMYDTYDFGRVSSSAGKNLSPKWSSWPLVFP